MEWNRTELLEGTLEAQITSFSVPKKEENATLPVKIMGGGGLLFAGWVYHGRAQITIAQQRNSPGVFLYQFSIHLTKEAKLFECLGKEKEHLRKHHCGLFPSWLRGQKAMRGLVSSGVPSSLCQSAASLHSEEEDCGTLRETAKVASLQMQSGG